AVCLALVGLSGTAASQAAVKKQTHIPAQGLGIALQSLARDRSFQLVYVSEEVDALSTRGAIGEYTSEEALTTLLAGTGLTFKYLNSHTVTILPAPQAPTTLTVPDAAVVNPTSLELTTPSDSGDSRVSRINKASVVKNVRLASAASAVVLGMASGHAGAQTTETQGKELEEVIVTGIRSSL